MENMKIHELTGVIADQTGIDNEPKTERSQNSAIPEKVYNSILQSLKMQSLGSFASSFAHDINNIFSVILTSSNILETNKTDLEKRAEILKSINSAVGRGKEIIGQILAFTGPVDVSLKPLSIPTFIYNTLTEIRRSLPANIKFKEAIDRDASYINADQDKLRQALLNLCTNACEAMPKGGTITVRINSLICQDQLSIFPTVEHDRYIRISISDTGMGIEENIKSRIFDPFFTTKEKGIGKGMGLSVVYGIVKAHSGFIDFDTKPGYGSTFNIYLPHMKLDKECKGLKEVKISNGIRGKETILVVEDDKPILELAHMIFTSKGYTVLTAEEGIEAVKTYKQNSGKISLVFMDIGLPDFSGREVFTMLKEIDPNVKVIFTSGSFFDIKETLIKEGAKDFIQKPYNQEDALRKIREVLDAN